VRAQKKVGCFRSIPLRATLWKATQNQLLSSTAKSDRHHQKEAARATLAGEAE